MTKKQIREAGINSGLSAALWGDYSSEELEAFDEFLSAGQEICENKRQYAGAHDELRSDEEWDIFAEGEIIGLKRGWRERRRKEREAITSVRLHRRLTPQTILHLLGRLEGTPKPREIRYALLALSYILGKFSVKMFPVSGAEIKLSPTHLYVELGGYSIRWEYLTADITLSFGRGSVPKQLKFDGRTGSFEVYPNQQKEARHEVRSHI